MAKVKIINTSTNALPAYATPQSAGLDLCAHTPEPINLEPGHRKLIKTGIFMEIPAGMEAQVRPRSGLALKKGLTVLNAPGTIDSDYRGEIGVILINHGQESIEIRNGDRIAQLVFAYCEQIEWNETNNLTESVRGAGGFGHTGQK